MTVSNGRYHVETQTGKRKRETTRADHKRPTVHPFAGNKDLPITKHSSSIQQNLRDKDVLLLVGETGSGKSTQVPQYLLNEKWNAKKCIAITQPRRVAAISLARRVAEELKTKFGRVPGAKVGYSVRFDNATSKDTRIKFLTEGMLLQEMIRDPWLTQYSAVIVDEVHERSVNVDLILGFVRKIITGDQDKHRNGRRLKTVIMSATADVDALCGFFQEGFGESKILVSKALLPGKLESIKSIPSNGAHVIQQAETSSKLDTTNGDDTMSDKKSKKKRNKNAQNPLLRGYLDSERETSSTNMKKAQSDSPFYKISTKSDSIPSEQSRKGSPPTQELPSSSHVGFVHVEGRQHPVKTFYTPEPVEDIREAAIEAILKLHREQPLPGDILVFLTGQEQIETIEGLLKDIAEQLTAQEPELPKLLILPLFASLPRQQQEAPFLPSPRFTRKIILSTNIAETSVTIPGIRHVVDSGVHKIKEYRSTLSLDSLLVKPISKSSATQRQGRAGREAAGTVHRLYTSRTYATLDERTAPEILRSDLSAALLAMKSRGIADPLAFPLLSPPPLDALKKALLHLHRLRALADDGAITPAGRQMARMPLPPSLAAVLVAAAAAGRGVLLDAIDIIAALSVENIFLPVRASADGDDDDEHPALLARASLLRREGDHLTLLAAVYGYVGAAEEDGEGGVLESGDDDDDGEGVVPLKRGSADALRRAWAIRHALSHRAMASVLNVRSQLRGLCVAEKLLPRSEAPGNGASGGAAKQRGGGDALLDARAADALLKVFLAGFADNVARLMPDGSYRTVNGGLAVAIHPGSSAFGRRFEAIVYNELVFTSRAFARGVSGIQLAWWADAVMPGTVAE